MARKKSAEPAVPDLVDAVSLLSEELQVLRIVIDELREEVQWKNQNLDVDGSRLAGRRIQSCSLDPTSRNFEVNSVDQKTIASLRAELAPNPAKPGAQGELFS